MISRKFEHKQKGPLARAFCYQLPAADQAVAIAGMA